MSLFWNKRIEFNKVIYTRTKSQRRMAYMLMVIGILLFFGLPTLVRNINFFREVFQWVATLFLLLIFLGPVLIIFTAIFASIPNFKLLIAKRKNKKFQITSTNEGDSVEIEE